MTSLSLRLSAEPVWYADLQDDEKTTVRLTSHLLIDPTDFSNKEIAQLFENETPIAFLLDQKTKLNTGQWLLSGIGKQKRIPIILTNKIEPNGSEPAEVVFIDPNQIDQVDLNNFRNDSTFTCNELLLATPALVDSSTQELLIKLWQQTGKLPNFIQADQTNLKNLVPIIDALNHTRKIFGVVYSNDQLLADIKWKDYPTRKTNGYFSFPLLPILKHSLIPYKAGYQFSPDIILDSPENIGFLKVFKAIELEADFGLVDHFIFNKEIRNIQRKNNEEILNNRVQFVHDEIRGDCAFYTDRAYIDGGIKTRSALKSNFSVTAWIKPTQLDLDNSILGKGTNFVLKIHEGLLTFTMQGIKDYFSPNSQVPLNEWTFISMVHSAYENEISFYVNGELTEKINLISNYVESDYTLLIGNNLWEQFFVGYMSDVKIWERELNSVEVRKEYANSMISEDRFILRWLMMILPILLILLPFIYFLQKRKNTPVDLPKYKTEKNLPELTNTSIPGLNTDQNEQILFFGGLKVFNQEGKDISLKFSPKIKQLFVLILLHCVDGQKGISSKKLSNILWPGAHPQNVKNTRGTSIQNLKSILSTCSGIKLIFKDKMWFIELSDKYVVDYSFVIQMMLKLEQNPKTDAIENQLPSLLSILKKGTLLPHIGESWLDPYIDKISNRIIEFGMLMFNQLDEKKHAPLILDLAEVISLNDPLNEIALQKKIRILTQQGKLSLAHTVYDNFTKLFFELYQENYPSEFKSIIHSTLHN